MMTMDAMPRIDRASLMTLETYARERPQFRAKVIAHKKDRTVQLGEHVTLVFEDELTIRYQVQEMLRIERIFEEEGIREELAAYNPLVPDGRNLKATMMIEYPDPEERAKRLAELIGIEATAQALKKGAGLTLGIDHSRYSATLEAPPTVRDSLVRDLA